MIQRLDMVQKVILLLMAAMLVLLVQCAEEPDPRIGKLEEAISQSLGLDREQVQYSEQDTAFVVGGDGLVTFEDAMLRHGHIFDEDKSGQATGVTQMFGYYPVAKDKQEVRLYCDPTVAKAWVQALDSAIRYYNDSVQCGIRYSRQMVSTGATTRVTSSSVMATGTVASAAYPSYYGLPGTKLTINTYYNDQSRMDSTRKIMVLAHELGHTVGFSHTDGSYGTLVDNTGPDPYSVMNSRVSNWYGFSAYDKAAFRSKYPK